MQIAQADDANNTVPKKANPPVGAEQTAGMIPIAPTAPTDQTPSIIGGGVPYSSSPVGDPMVPGARTDPTGTNPASPIPIAPSQPTPTPNPTTPGAGFDLSQISDGTPLAPPPGVSPLTPLTPSTPTPLPQTASAATSPSIPLATSPTSAPYASVTPTSGTSGNYLGQTIAPGAGVDRLKLAEDSFDTFAKSSDPYYQKTLRDANASAAANGRLGSGMLRTSLGDAANNRQLQLDSERDRLMQGATEGSIDDQYKNLGIAQQQQGFQANQQNTAFDQAARQTQLEEALRSGDFARAQGLLGAGMIGSPSDIGMELAGLFGGESSAAGAGAGSLLSNATLASALKSGGQAQAPDGGTSILDQLIASLTNGGLGQPPQGTDIGASTIPISKQPFPYPNIPTPQIPVAGLR